MVTKQIAVSQGLPITPNTPIRHSRQVILGTLEKIDIESSIVLLVLAEIIQE